MNLELTVQALKKLLPSSQVMLHQPEFAGKEWEYIKECLDTGWVSSVGSFVDRFERNLEEFTGVQNAVAVTNGTAALHLALRLVGVKGGDEVLLPSLTFVATANSVNYIGAMPHFVDVNESTLGVDPAKLAEYLSSKFEIKKDRCINRTSGRPVGALIVMHTFGHPVDLDPISEICSRFKIPLIEDAAEALGSTYKGKHVGRHGRISTLSFNGNKIATTGGGGAILTQDRELARLAKHLSTTAKIPHKWEFVHDQIGYNYRLPNINAALGCAQLEQLPGFLKRKRALAKRYIEAFRELKGAKMYEEAAFAQSNYWLNALILDEQNSSIRDPLLEATNSQGIQTRPIWTPMHRLPMFGSCSKMDLNATESLERRIINLPSSASLGCYTRDEVKS